MATNRKPCDLDQLADPVWDRAAGETAKAFAAFTDYLEIGADRTLKAVSNSRRPYYTVVDWAKRWRWPYRVDAWDRHVAAARRHRYLAEHEDMARRHARQAQAMLEVVTRPVTELLRRLQQDDPTARLEIEMLPIPALLQLVYASARVTPGLQAAEAAARGVDQAAIAAESVHVIDVDYGDDHLATVAATLIELGILPEQTALPARQEQDT